MNKSLIWKILAAIAAWTAGPLLIEGVILNSPSFLFPVLLAAIVFAVCFFTSLKEYDSVKECFIGSLKATLTLAVFGLVVFAAVEFVIISFNTHMD
jgi:hypothetical protein